MYITKSSNTLICSSFFQKFCSSSMPSSWLQENWMPRSPNQAPALNPVLASVYNVIGWRGRSFKIYFQEIQESVVMLLTINLAFLCNVFGCLTSFLIISAFRFPLNSHTNAKKGDIKEKRVPNSSAMYPMVPTTFSNVSHATYLQRPFAVWHSKEEKN